MAAKSILVKKYENRRLYDATNSRYVNLDEVAEMLRRGNDVRVVDAGSGEDITRLILTQIIVEGAKTPDSNFPLDILRQMVIASGRASQEGAIKYMKAMLDFYQNTYRAITPALNPFEFVQTPTASPSPSSDSKPDKYPVDGAEPVGQKGNLPDAEEVTGLKERVAELEKLVSSLAENKTASSKRARRAPARKGQKI